MFDRNSKHSFNKNVEQTSSNMGAKRCNIVESTNVINTTMLKHLAPALHTV